MEGFDYFGNSSSRFSVVRVPTESSFGGGEHGTKGTKFHMLVSNAFFILVVVHVIVQLVTINNQQAINTLRICIEVEVEKSFSTQ
jgi:hypothetical protein